jgi:Ca2+-transporting ATPase
MRTLREVTDLFPDARTAGLTPGQVAASRGRFGLNKLTPLPRESGWVKFLAKFDEPIIKILLAATLLKIAIDVFEGSALVGVASLVVGGVTVAAAYLFGRGRWVPPLLFALAAGMFGATVALGHPSVEGLAVMVAVGLATGVSFLSEYRSDREFEKLNAEKDAGLVKVMRGGVVEQVPPNEVVVGDLVVLEAGDEIPADGRLVRGQDLRIDQSLMTGESEPVRKQVAADDESAEGPDRPGCLYRGTQAVGGLGAMVVTNVGDDTMLGQIARRLSGDESGEDGSQTARVHRKLTLSKAPTPLQQKLADLATLISRVGYAAAGLIFVALLIRGAFFASPPEVFLPDTAAEALAVGRSLLGYFVYMVIIIVVAVPEGLPMSVTVSLALAMRKMTRANALVRQLVATETIGSATVICTDKTGTLTENRMQVVRVGAGGAVIERAARPLGDTEPSGPADWVGLNAAINSTATLGARDGKPVVVGNSTEGSLLTWLQDAGSDYTALRLTYPAVHRVAFSSASKRMTTVARVGGRLVAFVKGAPEIILDRCTHRLAADGARVPLTPADRIELNAQLTAASGQAMRTLAFAHVELPAETPVDEAALQAVADKYEQGLTFAGWVGIRDPLRAEVPAAVGLCRRAGIDVKMITGDNPETARAIAADAGLLQPSDALVLTSDEFEKLTDAELADRLDRLRVLARAKPLDKYRLVKALQAQGHVVAMTGDGTNDAPSLKAADVGLAMGVAGTEVAKEASAIVLLDDSFGTIVKAVHWGRALYENIQRFVQFQLTINVSALVIALVCPLLFGFEPPFTVLQLLWINVIMDTFAAVALCTEPPRAGLMRAPPKRRDESILTRAMRTNILLTAGFFVAVMLGLLWAMAGDPHNPGLFGTSDPTANWLARAGADKEMIPGGELSQEADGRWSTPAADGGRREWDVHFTARQATLFFTVYVFFQVWNQINCRSLAPDRSGLRGLWQNPYFVLISGLTVVGQVAIVTFGGRVFDVEPLPVRDWLLIAAGTASVLVFAEAARLVRVWVTTARHRSGDSV